MKFIINFSVNYALSFEIDHLRNCDIIDLSIRLEDWEVETPICVAFVVHCILC